MIEFPLGSDPLGTCLLDLDSALGAASPAIALIVGGGYGLYLKQTEILRSGERTLFDAALLPENRSTQDIDLFLRAEVVVDAARMKRVRDALDRLEFAVVPGSEYMQFAKQTRPAGQVKVDLLVGPLGSAFDADTVQRDARRIRPKAFGRLHAHPLDEAVAVEEHLRPLDIAGARSDGVRHLARIWVPQPFSYLVMKLLAFRDRANDARKGMAAHHALDIYRIVAMTTESEDGVVRRLAREHREDAKVLEARRVVGSAFASREGLGILRLREHPLFASAMDVDRLMAEMATILPPIEA